MDTKKSSAGHAPSMTTSSPSDREFVIARVFDAPRALVFKAWTDPKQMAQWWGPNGFTNPVCEMDVRPGGAHRIVMRGPDGTEYPVKGVYREVKEPERLIMTLDCSEHPEAWHDMVKPNRQKGECNPAGVMLQTVTFEDLDGRTKLTILTRFESAAIRDAMVKMGMNEGWSQSLERLAEHLAMKNELLVIERIFNAPIDVVWKAITDNKAIKQWSFDIKEFEPETGFEFQFYGENEGVKYLHRCEVTEVISHKKISYSWRYEGYEGNSLVTFELFAEGNKTRLRLTHEGLETFPKIPAFARANFVEGWTALIGSSLKEFIEQNESLMNEGNNNVASTSNREIITTRIFDAPRELMWEVWTDPKHVAQWWGPNGFTTTIEKMDVRQGGVWKHVMHGPDGTDYPNKSVFTEVVKPERIVYSHGGGRKGGPAAQFEATWTFEALGDKTRVTIHMLFPSAADRDKVVKEYGAIEGAKQTLGRLAEYLTKK